MLSESLVAAAIGLAERGLIPDVLTRWGIRRLLQTRLESLDRSGAAHAKFVESASHGPIAAVPEKANDQHYEVCTDFFCNVLGSRRKYSSCYFPEDESTLDGAEEAALELTCEHAELVDGQDILELGCGWGSLTLWMAENYPTSRITAVSNSSSQREYITAQAQEQGFADRVTVITADMNDFMPNGTFDRVVSVEMFEHMQNHAELLRRISTWLKPDGLLFVHIFCHKSISYPFTDNGTSDWMSRYFFSGGMMPSQRLLPGYDQHMQLKDSWPWNGTHYQRTLDSWLNLTDLRKAKVLSALEQTYGRTGARRWFHRWRIFFMACSELFGYENGNEWFVIHYLFQPKKSSSQEQ